MVKERIDDAKLAQLRIECSRMKPPNLLIDLVEDLIQARKEYTKVHNAMRLFTVDFMSNGKSK